MFINARIIPLCLSIKTNIQPLRSGFSAQNAEKWNKNRDVHLISRRTEGQHPDADAA